jgi:transcriptional regulator GlxA family with amidase domain
VHKVQDYIIDHLSGENSTEMLAELVAMSPKKLIHVFKEKTGTTIPEYITQLRLENAKTLLNNPDYTLNYIASRMWF